MRSLKKKKTTPVTPQISAAPPLKQLERQVPLPALAADRDAGVVSLGVRRGHLLWAAAVTAKV